MEKKIFENLYCLLKQKAVPHLFNYRLFKKDKIKFVIF